MHSAIIQIYKIIKHLRTIEWHPIIHNVCNFESGQNYVSVYRGTKMWDDAHSFKTRSFLCYDSSVSLEEELQYGCNEQEEFGKVLLVVFHDLIVILTRLISHRMK